MFLKAFEAVFYIYKNSLYQRFYMLTSQSFLV